MTDFPKQMTVAIQMNMYDPNPEPTSVLQVPMGGLVPTIVLAVDFDGFTDEEPKIGFKIHASGFPDTEGVTGLLRTLADHMDQHEHYEIAEDGVNIYPPTKPKEEG